jgi:hypothetical protein
VNHHAARGAIGDNFTVGKDDCSVSDCSDNLYIVRGQHHRVTGPSEVTQNLDESLLGGVVKSAGGLIEQHKRRLGTENNRERKAKTLTFREISGMGTLIESRHQPIEHCPSRSGGKIRVTICRGTFRSNSVVIQQHARVLRNKSRRTNDIARRKSVGLAALHQHLAPKRFTESD